MRFSLYRLAFCFECKLESPYTKQSSEKICTEEKVMIRLTFNPGLALTALRTILPCFQRVNLTRSRNPIESQHLVSGQLQKNA